MHGNIVKACIRSSLKKKFLTFEGKLFGDSSELTVFYYVLMQF